MYTYLEKIYNKYLFYEISLIQKFYKNAGFPTLSLNIFDLYVGT